MLELTIPDMTCAHCVRTITRAIGAIDSGATLDFDLPNHRLTVAGARDAVAVLAALEQEGYPASETADAGAATCCGSCQV